MVKILKRGGTPNPKPLKGSKLPSKQLKGSKGVKPPKQVLPPPKQAVAPKQVKPLSKAKVVGQKIGRGATQLGKGIGVKGALYITAGLTGVFVILRIRKEVNEWKPGDVFKAVTEDPLTLLLTSIFIGIIVWLVFFRGDK